MSRLLTIMLVACLLPTTLLAQPTKEVKVMTLPEAIQYALKNNPALQNAKVDVEIAKKKVTEVASQGLPQINASIDYTGNPQIPTTVIPNFNPQPGAPELLEFQMGIAHTLNAKLTANQLIFDGTYFLGLKAASQYVEMASRLRANTAVETQVNVTKAYYMALISDESLGLLDTNIKTLQKTYEDTKALYETGFAERIDAQRLELQLSNLKLQRTKLENQRSFAYRILKFQMGMDVAVPLMLKDNLKDLRLKANKTAADSSQGDFKQRTDFQILEQQQILNDLNVRRYQFGYVPRLTAFAQHQQNAFAQEGDFGNIADKFYPGTIWGMSLQIPIFSGFYRHSLVQQAKLETLKTRNDMRQLELAAENEIFQKRQEYITALENFENQKRNLELAREIYEIANIKQTEGVGSSLEVSNANNDMAQANNNYLNAIYELLVAELEFKKATGQIK